jgi:hypothetical protein
MALRTCGVQWLERFIEERNPTLAELALATEGLAEVGGAGDGACVSFFGLHGVEALLKPGRERSGCTQPLRTTKCWRIRLTPSASPSF